MPPLKCSFSTKKKSRNCFYVISILMALSEVLVFLIMQQKWRNVLLLNANPEVSESLVESLSKRSVPVASLDVESIRWYPWPEKFGFEPAFNGFVMTLADSGRGTEETLRSLLRSLKGKSMLNPKQAWIIGVDGCLRLSKVLDAFDEGDKVVIVGSKVAEFSCSLHQSHEEFHVWYLHSTGNGSTHFRENKFWNDSVELSEAPPLFDEPFANFGGRILRISALGSPPIKVPPLPGSTRWRGYIFTIINTLADVFNFSYVVKEADNRLYGMKQEDGSWSGMIGELVNKSVDLGVGDVSWTWERSLAVDLTYTVFPETVTFIYRTPGFYSRTWILFEDIDKRIWISLTSIMIVGCSAYGVILCVTELSANEDRWLKRSDELFVMASLRSVSSLGKALLGQGVQWIPKEVSCRIVLGTWFLGALILSALYGGSLTSTLSQHRSPRPADTLQALVRLNPNARMAVNNNSQIHAYIQESALYREIWTKNAEQNVIPGKLHIEDIMQKVHDGGSPIYVWIAERSMLVKQMYIYSDDNLVCDLYVAKGNIIASDWSLALVRNSPFFAQINDKILRLQRFGLLQKWHTDHWASGAGQCIPTDGLNPTGGRTPISITDTQASFFVLSLGWMAGFLTLFIERRIHP